MQSENRYARRGTLDILAGLRLQREAGKRVAILAGLCAILPPVGLVCLWRSRRVTNIVRIALTIEALLVMVLVMSLLRPREGVNGIQPAAVKADRSGYLVNIPDPTATPAPGAVSIIYSNDTQEGTDNSVQTAFVYAADGIDTYYHATANADNMVNLRQLTYAQAQQEGLTPCPNCYPEQGNAG